MLDNQSQIFNNCGQERCSLFDEVSVLVDRELDVDVENVLCTDDKVVVECRAIQLEQTQWNVNRKLHYLALQFLPSQYTLSNQTSNRLAH